MRDILRLAMVLTIIAAGAGLILSLVEAVTREPIAEQRRLETLRALQSVLPSFDNNPDQDTLTLTVGEDRKGQPVERTFYRARQNGALVGTAFSVVSSQGYSGNIATMVGVRPDGTVTGIAILNHAETPGLGTKIEEPWFKEQFVGKNLDNVDWRVEKDGGDFDQITGATISPRAVVTSVADGLQFYREHRSKIIGVAAKKKDGL